MRCYRYEKNFIQLNRYLIHVVPVFDQIEAYAPGFKESVVGREVLTPPDLEKIFGLTGGVSLGSDFAW